MKLKKIFRTIQGEGLWSGAICTFIRFAGCSLRCRDCDTQYSWESNDLPDSGVPFIIDEVLKIDRNPRHICITGGEPLEQPQAELFSLLQVLQSWYGARGLQSIVIETNGAQDVRWLLDKPFRKVTHLSVDYKLPCTGRTSKMLMSNFENLDHQDVIKFICKDQEDFEVARKVLIKLHGCTTCQPVVLFHALGGKPTDWLAKEVLGLNSGFRDRWDCRAGIQLHKLYNVE